MCGIVGVVSNSICSVKNDLLSHIDRLSYRGYDSCGYALSTGALKKGVGKISDFVNSIEDEFFRSGLAHTRWATHGGKTWTNAHPHTNKDHSIFAVHNGIIENYQEIRSFLESKGYQFTSQTDTEVIPHYFDLMMNVHGRTVEQTIQQFFYDVRGTFAVLLQLKGENKVYAFKKDSPLVLGVGDGFNIVASDIYAFCNKTTNAIFFEDGEYAVITATGAEFRSSDGTRVTKQITQVESEDESTTDDYPHFTIKEIKEQPYVSQRIIRSLRHDQNKKVEKLCDLIHHAKRTVFVACGTSYHASLIGGAVLSRMGYSIHNIIASEFDTFYKVDRDTLIVAISQSGETMDVVTVIKEAKKRGAKIASLVNVPYSTVQRESDVSIDIRAGQEVAVASTKAFTNQVIALLYVAKALNPDVDIHLEQLPANIQKTIDTTEDQIRQLAKDISKHNHVFFLGRGMQYPVAREMALKLKEITYIHAEGMMAGELKHGSIALIDPNDHTPVICLIPNNDAHMTGSTREVEARGAHSILVTNNGEGLVVPSTNGVDFALYATVVGQLLAYYTAVERGCDVDQPRNLAKSVTVH